MHHYKMTITCRLVMSPFTWSVKNGCCYWCWLIQEYLTRHYAERERSRQSQRHSVLPYTTSGHTILKKSSTDPTSDRATTSTSAPVVQLKHTTFCDRVTVLDQHDGQVTVSVRLFIALFQLNVDSFIHLFIYLFIIKSYNHYSKVK